MKNEIIERIKYLQDKAGNPFDEQFPCIQTGCDNNGTIQGFDVYQCQYCDEIRTPLKSFISSELSSLARAILEKKQEADILEQMDVQVVSVEDIEAVCGERGVYPQ